MERRFLVTFSRSPHSLHLLTAWYVVTLPLHAGSLPSAARSMTDAPPIDAPADATNRIVVPKTLVRGVLQALRLLGADGLCQPGAVRPVDRDTTSVVVDCKDMDIADVIVRLEEQCRVEPGQLRVVAEEDPDPPRRRAKRSPREKIVENLQQSRTWCDLVDTLGMFVGGAGESNGSAPGDGNEVARATEELVPQKWVRLGDVVVVRNLCAPLHGHDGERLRSELGRAMATCLRARCVVAYGEVICGELRTPPPEKVLVMHCASASSENGGTCPPTETVHTENGIKYCMDVARVMFAPGNGTERLRARQYCLDGEVVVDMFAGIGYFSVPMGVSGRLNKLVCIEKNPVSVSYLRKNMTLNKVPPELVYVYEGDNREAAEEWIGRADRISMGYLPSAEPFIARAFLFLRPGGGVIHYHYLCGASAQDQSSVVEQHFQAQLMASGVRVRVAFTVDRIVVVKSYAPNVLHCVADVRISPQGD